MHQIFALARFASWILIATSMFLGAFNIAWVIATLRGEAGSADDRSSAAKNSGFSKAHEEYLFYAPPPLPPPSPPALQSADEESFGLECVQSADEESPGLEGGYSQGDGGEEIRDGSSGVYNDPRSLGLISF